VTSAQSSPPVPEFILNYSAEDVAAQPVYWSVSRLFGPRQRKMLTSHIPEDMVVEIIREPGPMVRGQGGPPSELISMFRAPVRAFGSKPALRGP
jgi:hypothetical protein